MLSAAPPSANVDRLHTRRDRPLDLADAGLVALVEDPLLDPLRFDEPRLREHLEVNARRRLADAELLGDQDAAHAVLYEVPVHLRRKVRLRVLEPLENLQPALV